MRLVVALLMLVPLALTGCGKKAAKTPPPATDVAAAPSPSPAPKPAAKDAPAGKTAPGKDKEKAKPDPDFPTYDSGGEPLPNRERKNDDVPRVTVPPADGPLPPAPAPAGPMSPRPAPPGNPAANPPPPAGGAVVTKQDLEDIRLFIDTASGASGVMPAPAITYDGLAKAGSPAAALVKSGAVVLTGTRTREGVWAYEAKAPQQGGLVVTSNGVETMTAAELRQRLGR